MRIILLIHTLTAVALAIKARPNVLFRRQSNECPTGYKICGIGCIERANTCCPDGAGGCDPTENCQLGSDGEYGCCPKGETCVGEGGVITSDIYDTTSYLVTTPRASITTTSPRATTTYGGGADTCPAGWKVCGQGCLPSSWQCCPDQLGGCDSSIERCWLGDNGNYGCCANIYTAGCTGDAGTSQSTIDITGYTTATQTDYALSTTSRAVQSTPSPLTSATRASTTSSTSATSSLLATPIASGSSDAIPMVDNPLSSVFSVIVGGIVALLL